jgi:radical SAM superfamily enzyme YgiQ (UPF0313 family)
VSYDIVLFTGFQNEPVKTFGAYKCAHELRQAGFRTLVVGHLHDLTITELTKILDLAVGANTLFVGFSTTFLATDLVKHSAFRDQRQRFHNFLPYGDHDEKQFVDHLKLINPNCKIVAGGTRIFFDIRNKYVDYAIIGYGDLSIVNLAQHIKDGVELRKARRNLHKIIVIDDPVAEGFDFANSSMQWCDDDIVIPREGLPLEISRGCVFSCKFCMFRLNGKNKLDYLKKYETIRSELLYNYEKYNITTYRLLDDTYNDTKEKIDIMLDIVKSLPFEPLFWTYLRLDLMSKHPETIDKIVKTGIRSMFFGIETLHKKTGTIIGKGYDPDEQVETIRYIKKTYGDQVRLHGAFICGLPYESKEHVQLTMDRLMSADIPLDTFHYNPLLIMKKDYRVWDSAFGLDMTKFGYRELPETHSDGVTEEVAWESDIMTSLEAKQMCADFLKTAGLSRRQKFKSFYDRSTVNSKNTFIPIYKTQLFKHLGADSDFICAYQSKQSK